MSKHRNLMTVCFAAVFALGLAACSSSNDDPPAAEMTDTSTDTSTEPTASEPTPATLESVQTDAATAATAAQTAATAAQTAADAAEMARAARAAIQTGDFHAGNSGGLADKAQEHADAAQAAADDASDASDAAADATDVSSATRALVMAEAAKATAEKQLMYAESAQGNAMTAAAGEISIVEKTKTVDGTSIPIDEMTHTSTINEVTNNTGLQTALNITTTGEAIGGTPLVQEDLTATPPVAAAAAIPGAVVRMLDIGFTYDSGDDDARVTLVHSYAGTKTVTAFADNSADDLTGAPGKIDHDGDEVQGTSTAQVALSEASGTFVVSEGGIEDGNNIAAGSMPVTIYYYTNTAGMKEYVRVEGSATSTSTGAVTNTYQHVDIRAGTKIPDPTMYSHLHFGVWSGLNGKDDGTNTVADLGLGFVANIGEMTSNMPNFGTARYAGNWVANVQADDEEGDGDFSRHDGEASMTANFGMGEVDVTLTGLATLDGTIDGNTFSGTKATLAVDNGAIQDEARDMLGQDAKFAGNFSGAFFGNLAAEAGGVFDFASDDDNDGANEGGAFRGAFGADQKPPAQ